MQVQKAVTILCLAPLALCGRVFAQSPVPAGPAPSTQSPDTQLSGLGVTAGEQSRKAQEQKLGGVLAQFSAAESLMHRGQNQEAIAAYQPLLQNELNFTELREQSSAMKSRLDALQDEIFQEQQQNPIQATATIDALTTERVALEGRQHAVQKLLQLLPSYAEAHANMAHLLLQTGAAAAGLRHYQDAVRLNPSLAASLRPAIFYAHLVEADRLAKLGRPEAAAEYRAALTLDPANASAHFGLGSLLLALGKPNDALPELGNAVRLDPALSDAALMRGLALYRAGREEDARQEWRRLAGSANPRVAEEAQGMLDRYLLPSLPVDTTPVNPAEIEVRRCREAVRNFPQEASTHNNLAFALFHDGQKEEALQEIQTALRLDPDSLEAHNNLGRILADKAQGDAAVEEYKRALKLDSDNGAVHNNLGVVYFNRQQWKPAEYEFRKALEGEHADPYAHYNLAAVLLQEDRLADSIKECGKTLQYDPKFFAAYGTRGLVEDKQGQTAQALADLTRAVQSSADPAQALLNLADPLRQYAGPHLAATQFRTVLALFPPSAAGQEALGRLRLAAGEDREAIDAFQTAIRLDPARATGHLLLARSLLRLGHPADAADAARAALQIEPKSADAMNTLGSALYQTGQRAAGRAQWQAALNGDNKDAARNAAAFLAEFPEQQ